MINLEDDIKDFNDPHFKKIIKEHWDFVAKARKAFKNGKLDCVYRSMHQKVWKKY